MKERSLTALELRVLKAVHRTSLSMASISKLYRERWLPSSGHIGAPTAARSG